MSFLGCTSKSKLNRYFDSESINLSALYLLDRNYGIWIFIPMHLTIQIYYFSFVCDRGGEGGEGSVQRWRLYSHTSDNTGRRRLQCWVRLELEFTGNLRERMVGDFMDFARTRYANFRLTGPALEPSSGPMGFLLGQKWHCHVYAGLSKSNPGQ